MSWVTTEEPQAQAFACPGVEMVIEPRLSDLGGFQVGRVLPFARRRMLGPFIFLDQIGPMTLAQGRGIDVRPHPHIGLATITWLFAGTILHRDSLGNVQPIRPGEVNWMTAGRGIAHSERTPAEHRRDGEPLHGLQAWVALPSAREESPPAFAHHEAGALPVMAAEGVRLTVIAGEFATARSPVETHSPLIYAEATLAPGATLPLPAQWEERGIYVVEGAVELAGERFGPGRLLVLRQNGTVPLAAPGGARLMVMGGDRLDGPRHIWWNFVSSSKDRIEQAKADWRERRLDHYGAVPEETEFIPLPD